MMFDDVCGRGRERDEEQEQYEGRRVRLKFVTERIAKHSAKVPFREGRFGGSCKEEAPPPQFD